MPSWSLSDLMSNATTRAGRRSDLAASTVSFWVNQAYQDFVRDVPELLSERTAGFSVSSGNSLLTIPADFREAINLSEVTTAPGRNRDIPQISAEWADARGYYPVGETQGYFLYQSQIQLWPSASSSALTTHASSGRSYLLRYRWIPTDMSATTAVPSVATEHRIGILYRAEQYIHELVGNVEEAAMSGVRYTQFVATIKDSIARRHAARSPIRVSLDDRSNRRTGRNDSSDDWLRT